MNNIDLIIILRSIGRNPVENLIKISGLSLAFAALIIIYLYISHELSFDRFHERSGNIYRLEMGFEARGSYIESALTPPLAGKSILAELAGVEGMTRLFTYGWKEEALVLAGDRQFYEKDIFLTDPSFFDFFSFELLAGSKEHVFEDANSVVLSKRCSERYFGEENPVGKLIHLKNFGDIPLVVRGIIADAPLHSHFSYELLIPATLGKDMYWQPFLDTWRNRSFYTYIQLGEKANAGELELAINELINSKESNPLKDADYRLRKLEHIHLYSHHMDEIRENGSIRPLIFALAIGLVIAIIALSNYTSISLAQIFFRAREVGIKKLFGRSPTRLSASLIMESVCFAICSALIAILLIELFSGLTGQYLQIEQKIIHNQLDKLWGILLLAGLCGILAGIFPAILYSSYRAIDVLKGKLWGRPGKISARKMVTIMQFILLSALLTITYAVSRQNHFLTCDEAGFDLENVIVIPLKDHSSRQAYQALKASLLAYPEIVAVSGSSSLPFNSRSRINISCEGYDKDIPMTAIDLDFDLEKVYHMTMLEGRSFSKAFSGDDKTAYIINETAAAMLGWKEAVGKGIHFSNKGLRFAEYPDGKVVGIVKDFFHSSKHHEIQAVVLKAGKNIKYVSIRHDPGAGRLAGEHIAGALKETYPGLHFDAYPAGQLRDALYHDEQGMNRIFLISTIMAILISLVSMLSMSKLEIRKKYREIALRIVLGAEKTRLAGFFLKKFLPGILLANLVSIPLAWVITDRWLQGFAYHAGIPVMGFVFSFLLVALCVSTTIVIQVWHTAGVKAIDILKYE